jgi:hypothetical protein
LRFSGPGRAGQKNRLFRVNRDVLNLFNQLATIFTMTSIWTFRGWITKRWCVS